MFNKPAKAGSELRSFIEAEARLTLFKDPPPSQGLRDVGQYMLTVMFGDEDSTFVQELAIRSAELR
jgi:hypothetical protein